MKKYKRKKERIKKERKCYEKTKENGSRRRDGEKKENINDKLRKSVTIKKIKKERNARKK